MACGYIADMYDEDWGIRVLRGQPGLMTWLGPQIGVSQPAISKWAKIPSERAKEIARVTGIPLHMLRPDLWPPPWFNAEEPPSAPMGEDLETVPVRKPRPRKPNNQASA
jgi:hypothetical protein